MAQFKTYSIEAHYDFELNIPRKTPLTYHFAYGSNKPKGIIFIIPGFGADANLQYQTNLLKYIAQTHNLMAVFVEYHGIYSRLENGATMQFDSIDIEYVIQLIEKYNINLQDDQLDFSNIVSSIDNAIKNQIRQNILPNEYKEILPVTLIPKKNEYQNFGILQAIDILTALYHIKSLNFDHLINTKPIYLLGSSHGAYICNLLLKIAPNTFDTIIDNSSYIKPPLKYIMGKITDIKKPEIVYNDPNLTNLVFYAFTLNFWSTDANSPHHFSKSAYEIRDISNVQHLEKASKEYNSKTKVISYHSKLDSIAIYQDKQVYFDLLKKLNMNNELITIESENQIDGKLIKNLDHAMGMSNKTVIDTLIPKLLQNYIKKQKTNLSQKSTIRYQASTDEYIFQFKEDIITTKLKKNI